jgi:hypothetical protein
MRIFTIKAGPHKGKHIHVTRYVTTAPGPDGRAGLEIKIAHNVPAVAGKQHQWVQTVSSNRGFSIDCGMLVRVDPFGHGGGVYNTPLPAVPGICMADDLLPFYWTAADLAAGAGPGLSDQPRAAAPAAGRTWTQFVTALAEVTGNHVHHLVAIFWGYDRMADGSVNPANIRPPTIAEMAAHGHALKRMYPAYKYT